MFGVHEAPSYVAETHRSVARLQEQTTPEQYSALAGRAHKLLEGMFQIETRVDPELMVKIALRERFVAPRVKQAILVVATHQLIRNLAQDWRLLPRPIPRRETLRESASSGTDRNASRAPSNAVLCRP